jgi:hypothetical protein
MVQKAAVQRRFPSDSFKEKVDRIKDKKRGKSGLYSPLEWWGRWDALPQRFICYLLKKKGKVAAKKLSSGDFIASEIEEQIPTPPVLSSRMAFSSSFAPNSFLPSLQCFGDRMQDLFRLFGRRKISRKVPVHLARGTYCASEAFSLISTLFLRALDIGQPASAVFASSSNLELFIPRTTPFTVNSMIVTFHLSPTLSKVHTAVTSSLVGGVLFAAKVADRAMA